MQKEILLVSFILLNLFGYSQTHEQPYPNFISQSLSTVENHTDWNVLQKATGDLNNDGLYETALILESKDSILEKRCASCRILKNKPRIIVVFLNQTGTQKAIIQNNTFIARGDEGGMAPYLEPEISITNGMLTVYYQYTRSNQSYTFALKNETMPIVSAKSNGVEAASGNFENDSYNFEKGELITETGNIKEEHVVSKVIKFDVQPKLLSEFGEMYDWEIVENKFL